MVRTVDMDSLVPDDSLTIEEGAVAPWNSLMWSLMVDVCREKTAHAACQSCPEPDDGCSVCTG